uniref:Uncharacterized protein n=1 Tax=Anguilla anguilla TaxID=7936 RepID=A0A0E9PS00_ANGAN
MPANCGGEAKGLTQLHHHLP